MALSISEAQAGLISSLSPDDIPIKLRCAICSKLAVNAFRLPCCEQAICESCQSSLPQSCPVCEHSPLAAEDCNPNKSLRTTIRVFLRTAEKKREASRSKESKDSTPATPIEASKPSAPAPDTTTEGTVRVEEASGSAKVNEEAIVNPENGLPQSSIQDAGPEQKTQPEAGDATTLDQPKSQESALGKDNQQLDSAGAPGQLIEASAEHSGADGVASPHQPEAEKTEAADGENDRTNYGMDGGFSNNMMFSGSGGGDFNQMQMMMAMQNGMNGNSFAGFPMMGMGIDPMTMQNMYMNGGFQGMGMNGMGGYGGGFGQGSNNNWNGSQSWSFDQNNYNQNGLGMGTGDYGNFNAGFQTGYNQGNYGQFNDYRRNNFGRGRGRGRGYYGGYGRGGFQQDGSMTSYQNQGHYSQQHGSGNQTQGHVDSDPKADTQGTGQTVEHGSDSARQPGDEGSQGTGQQPGHDGNAITASGDSSQPASRNNSGHETPGDVSYSKGNSAGESGVIRSVPPTPDVPINAPTGPKAMRQGLPNTSLHHLRARGYQVDAAPSAPAAMIVKPKMTSDDVTRPGSRTPNREGEKQAEISNDHTKAQSTDYGPQDIKNDDAPSRSRDQSRSPSRKRDRSSHRSRSRSRGHRSSRRERRPRSTSAHDDYGNGYRHRKSRSSRKYHDDDDHHVKEDRTTEKSRSVSPDESRKSGHRGHKEKEHESRRDRERHRDGDRHKSSHRSHRSRDRSRSRDRDRDRDHDHSRRRERDSDRERERRERKERHRERDRDRHHRHDSSSRRPSDSRRSSSPDKGYDPASAPRNPNGRGASTRNSHDRPDREQNESTGGGAKTGTSKDPHTVEREARNRERLLKEAQRMAGLTSLAGAKRGRENGDDGGRKPRRVSRREASDGDEERMRRLEAEREGGRWD
ncbi:hypothetical protein HIM_03372 [Hirsutella minnesotensis 3608]|uniref:RING-type domain-containing protein n=1 Tax=Hirsutella minnesotensis 3608 TaxID=1043627 RepID=A0A0F7ZM83_9HYPO|nr:hypothetical protein HIM_03372 [Hirsutella minnesotensis 3608]